MAWAIAPIMKFETTEEAIALANDSEYGLSACVFGASDEANAVARHIDAGGISINDASLTAFVHEFGHESFKMSGLGIGRMGPDGLHRWFVKKAFMENDGFAITMPMLMEGAAAPE